MKKTLLEKWIEETMGKKRLAEMKKAAAEMAADKREWLVKGKGIEERVAGRQKAEERRDVLAEETGVRVGVFNAEDVKNEEKKGKEIIRLAMSELGKVKTTKKAAASRENGKKGGRPRKRPADSK